MAGNEDLVTFGAQYSQMLASSHRILISVMIPGSYSKFKSHNPSDPQIWRLEKKAIFTLNGRYGSPVIGMNAVYVRPASWRSSTVIAMSSICDTSPYVGKSHQ